VLRSLRVSESAMQREQTRIDTLAHNLANASSAGFKQILTRVTERDGTPLVRPTAGDDASRIDMDGLRGWPRQRDLVMSQALDLRQGAIAATGRDTDVALQGGGFFVVRDAGGGEFYTRNGAFRLDENRRLVTAQGQVVQGTAGPLVIEGGDFTIGPDGTVTVDGGGSPGRLRIVAVPEPDRLEHRGESLLAVPPEVAVQDVPKEEVSVLQGYLESSNVDPVQTLVDMIVAQRAFEVETKVLQTNDELLGRSVNTLGQNR